MRTFRSSDYPALLKRNEVRGVAVTSHAPVTEMVGDGDIRLPFPLVDGVKVVKFNNIMLNRRGFRGDLPSKYARAGWALLLDFDEDIVETAIRMAARVSPRRWGLPFVRKCAEELVGG